MTFTRRISFLVALVLGGAALFGSEPWALARRGPKIDIGDDPSIKEGSPDLVLVEVADFQ